MAGKRVSNFIPMLAVLAGGMALVHVLVAAVVLGTVARGEGIGDWTSFYAAATMVRTGEGGQLYDFGRQSATQLALFGGGLTPNAYPLPAFVAIAIAPLSRLSFSASFWLFFAANCALMAGLLRAAWRHLRPAPRGMRIAFVACAACSTPAVTTLLLGQLDLFVLAAMLGCYALLARGRSGAAGAVLAVALIKPHVALAVVLLLLVTRQWRALGGFAAVGAPLLLAPALALGPHTLVDQARLIASYPGSSTDHSVAAAMMINVRGAAVSITGSSSVWLWLSPLAAIAGVAAAAAVRTWRRNGALDAQSWAVALALPLLYSPHLHLQTMVLLVAAAALYLRATSDAGPAAPVELVLGAYVAVAAFWLLSIAGVALMFVPVLFAYRTLVRAWPRRAGGVVALAPGGDLAIAS